MNRKFPSPHIAYVLALFLLGQVQAQSLADSVRAAVTRGQDYLHSLGRDMQPDACVVYDSTYGDQTAKRVR